MKWVKDNLLASLITIVITTILGIGGSLISYTHTLVNTKLNETEVKLLIATETLPIVTKVELIDKRVAKLEAIVIGIERTNKSLNEMKADVKVISASINDQGKDIAVIKSEIKRRL